MGSNSDYPIMRECEKILKNLKINFETKIISAHRTPDRMYKFAKSASKSFSVVIAGAGGAPPAPAITTLKLFDADLANLYILSGVR